MPFRFDIQTPDPRIPLQAQGLDLGRERNRLFAETQGEDLAFRGRQEQRAEDRYTREQKRQMLQDTALAYHAAGQLPPERRDAAIAAHRDRLADIYGEDAVSDFTPRYEQFEYDNLSPYMPQAETPDLPSGVREYQFAQTQGYPGSFAQWKEENRALGTTINMPGAKPLGQRLPTEAEYDRGGYKTPEQRQNLLVDETTGRYVRTPEAPAEQEARATRTREAKSREALRPVLDALYRYRDVLKDTGAELLNVGKGADLNSAYTQATLRMKEAEKLGVLTGEDLTLLQTVLVPPVGAGALVSEGLAKMGEEGTLPAYESTLNSQIAVMEDRLGVAPTAPDGGAPREIEGVAVVGSRQDASGRTWYELADGRHARIE